MKTITLDGVEYELKEAKKVKTVVISKWFKFVPECIDDPYCFWLDEDDWLGSWGTIDVIHIHREYELDQDGKILSVRDLTKEKQDE